MVEDKQDSYCESTVSLINFNNHAATMLQSCQTQNTVLQKLVLVANFFVLLALRWHFGITEIEHHSYFIPWIIVVDLLYDFVEILNFKLV